MVELEIASWSDGPGAPPDWRTVSETSLRYDRFLGDVRVRLAGADFTTAWSWVPVLDFASGTAHLLHRLQPGDQEVFEFTESEAALTFRRRGHVVEVTATYADGLAVVAYAELRAAAEGLLSQVGRDLQDRHPDLRFNPAFVRLAALPGLRSPEHPGRADSGA